MEKDKIIKLNFYEKGNSYSYGSYPNATLGIYMNESFNGNEGGFTTQNVKLTGTLTNVWKVDGKYGWKGSAHVGDSDFESEAWVVSPIIDLAKAKAPLLKVDIAINFLMVTIVLILLNCWLRKIMWMMWLLLNGRL